MLYIPLYSPGRAPVGCCPGMGDFVLKQIPFCSRSVPVLNYLPQIQPKIQPQV